MASNTERLSQSQKNSNKQKWYRDRIDKICSHRLSDDDRQRMRVNYRLFNNMIDSRDFDYICKPFGENVGRLPANFQNRDIVSGKIKTIMGMEMQRPFSYKVFSVNPEATTEREKKEFGMLRDYVVEQIMAPVRQELEAKRQQAMQQMQQEMMASQAQQGGQGVGPDGMPMGGQGGAPMAPMSPMGQGMGQGAGMPPQGGIDPSVMQQKQQELEQKLAEEEKRMTPPEIKRYMARDYQDPAEVLATQLLAYLEHKVDLKAKMSDMFRNALITARSVMYIGILNDEPECWVINPMRFNFSKSSDTEFIEDGEWAVCEYRMSPSQVLRYFGKELSDKDVDLIHEYEGLYGNPEEWDLFAMANTDEDEDASDIIVYHCVWKGLRKIGFLKYIDESGQEQVELVDESYRLEKDLGEVSIEWEWIPECYEGWKIDIDEGIYCTMRPVPGQFKDIDTMYECKLPYYGLVYDSYNAKETSLMDRIKGYQYMYNIVMYRLELLMASDKGKKLMMNINSVPDALGIDMHKWQYFVESSPYIWYNPNEEGVQTGDANTVAKVMDLSLVSDIKKYMDIAEYIRVQAGKSVGITEQVEGQIGQYEAVRNTNQALIQSSYILEGYFSAHERCKVNVITALLEMAKVCYAHSKPKKLSYIIDDLSKHIIDVDPYLLDNSSYGIFVSSTSKTSQTKEMIQQLAHAALQTQTVEFSDIIAIMNTESVSEAEEILRAAQEKRMEQMQEQQKQQQQQQQQMQEAQMQAAREKHQMDMELVKVKEEERRKTELAKMALMGASYNPDKDTDGDGMNDFLELAKTTLTQYESEENLRMQAEKLELDKSLAMAKSAREDKVAAAKVKEANSKISDAKYRMAKAQAKGIKRI